MFTDNQRRYVMRKTKRLLPWWVAFMSLLLWLYAEQIKSADAQSGQRTFENIPGIPAGYTIIDGDIQMPIDLANAMRRQTGQEGLAPKSPQATFNNIQWPNGIVPFEF